MANNKEKALTEEEKLAIAAEMKLRQEVAKNGGSLLPHEVVHRLRMRMDDASSRHGTLGALYREAMPYVFPGYSSIESSANVPIKRTVLDKTPHSYDPCISRFLNEFSANMISKVFPPQEKWLKFFPSDAFLQDKTASIIAHDRKMHQNVSYDAGDDRALYEEIKGALDKKFGEITERFFEILQQSNFYETLSSLTHNSLPFGTMTLMVDDNHDHDNNPSHVSFNVVNPLDLFAEITDDGAITGAFRWSRCVRRDVQVQYPGFRLEALNEAGAMASPEDADKELTFWESCTYEPNVVEGLSWAYRVFYNNRCGYEAWMRHNPFVIFFWSRQKGENLGRGPLIDLFPSIKRLDRLLYLSTAITQRIVQPKILVGQLGPDIDVKNLVDLDKAYATVPNVQSVQFYPPPQLPPTLREEIAYIRESIISASMKMNIPVQPNMTAQEFTMRVEESIAQTAGQVGSLQMRFVIPLVNLIFDKMVDNGDIDRIMVHSPATVQLNSGDVYTFQSTDIDLSIGNNVVKALSLPWQASNIKEINGLLNVVSILNQVDPTGETSQRIVDGLNMPHEVIDRNQVSSTGFFLGRNEYRARLDEEAQALQAQREQALAAVPMQEG